MPMKSKAQRGFLWKFHPDIAKEFEDKTPNGTKLPTHVEKKKKKKKSFLRKV
jgi:hypothetical protein